ncbi:MAG: foldase protein prsA 1 [Pseudomonadota bacterium]|jgi:parvulin-like peptidyl-prolyl isomerase
MSTTTYNKLFLLLSLVLISSCKNNFHTSLNKNALKENDKILATFEGGDVRLSQVKREFAKITARDEKLKKLTFDDLTSEQKKIIINEVVVNDVSYQKAKELKLNNDDDYQEALKLFETELLKQKLYIHIADQIKQEENLKKNYQQLASKLANKKDYRFSYIALKDEKDAKKEADEIYEKLLKNPQKFSDIAKKKSIDKDTAKKGGDLGYIVEDALPTEILSSLKKLKKGQVSKPILSANRFLIIKFIDERKAEILPFDKAKEALAQGLIKKALEDFNSQAVKDSQIKYLE